MKIVFEIPADQAEIIEDIRTQCAGQCTVSAKDSLSGDQLIAIAAIVTPVVWELVNKYLPQSVTIEVELDEEHTVTITDRSFERAKMKAKKYREEWEKTR